MPGVVFIAVVGLLLLIPLEVVFLIVLAALKRSSEAPKIVVPELKKQERYGWEDYLKLPPEKKAPASNTALLILVVAAVLILIAAPSYLFGVPQFLFNSALNATDVEETEEQRIAEPEAEIAPSNFSLNITLPRLNLSLPEVDISVLREKAGLYKPYAYAVVVAVVALVAALAVFIYVVNRRKMAVIHKAGKTADKLMKKDGRGKKLKLKALLSKLPSLRPYLAPIVILFLLVMAALLVYLFRDRLIADFAGLALKLIVKVRAFALNYRLYVAAGVAALIVLIVALRRSKKKA
ncbi:hypothetical protein J4470_00795 [Candidatus Woesearchaeota archaeon]|nr:hypothetical protein [Candidatus Woesearchaeota archaeon]